MLVRTNQMKASESFRPSLTASVIPILMFFFPAALAAPVESQDSTQQADSVVDAARKARERKANSTRHPKLITNADLGLADPAPNDSASLVSWSSDPAGTAAPPTAGSCDHTEAQQLKRELQAAEHELANLHHEITIRSPRDSNRDIDLQYFRPGSTGLDVGSPPLLNSEPPAPARVAQVELEERIASLQKALRIACAPPEAAAILIKVDDLEQQLTLLLRKFALDQDTYYSKTDFAQDTAGSAQLDAEQRQIQILQARIELLKQELASIHPPHSDL